MNPDVLEDADGAKEPDRIDQMSVLRVDQSLAGFTSLMVLLVMPFVAIAALLTYGLLDGWHLLALFPFEMMAAQFGWIGNSSFVAIGSLRTAATVYIITASKHRWRVTILVLGVQVLMAIVTHDRIYGNGR